MRTRSLAVLAALTMALTACSGGGEESTTDDAPAAAAEGALTFTGTGTLAWAETSKEAAAGELDVTIVCDGAVPHNVVIEGVNGDEIVAECDGDAEGTGTVELEAGTYTYFCNIPGHREAGMEGELTVS